MTAPRPGGETARLTAVARWDVWLLRRAVATLATVAARLPALRMRLEGVGRSLDSAECWSGPAATSAAAAVVRISTVATAVDGAVDDSLAGLHRLSRSADEAQNLATRALAVTGPSDLDAAIGATDRLTGLLGVLSPVPMRAFPEAGVALAEAALERAADATRAARASGDALARVTNGHLAVPATFGDLAARIALDGPVRLPDVPFSGSPAAVARWWAGLSGGVQSALILVSPQSVGGIDGVPAWARDRANRLILTRAVSDPGVGGYVSFTARAVAARIEAEEAAGREVQLQTLDLAGDRMALAFGNLDSAEAVALLVPGIGNSPGDDLAALAGDARDLAAAAQAAAPAMAVATVVWLGYRTPSSPPEILTRDAARRGGAALAAELDGLAEARAVTGRPPARTTLVAHSYGTVVVDEAAGVPGTLQADAVILLGSPGTARDAAGLEAPEVYDAASAADPVSWSGWFGAEPWAPPYGATELPVAAHTGHTHYYDVDRPTLRAMGAVVVGARHPH